MIRFTTGDILGADCEALVNTVNCVGVMGRGVALQFKKAFPDNFKAYAAACKRSEVVPGRMFVFDTGSLANPRLIVNFPTKRHWRAKSRIEDIEAGLRDLASVVRTRGVRSMALPPLGCGLGGLEWSAVKPCIEAALSGLDDLHVVAFEPKGAPEARAMARHRRAPGMTAGRAALVELMDRYRSVLLDPFITLLEVQKLMYFMQVAGEPLKLKYAKAGYGPYAENLRHVLNDIEGHYVVGYADGGDSPDKPLEAVPAAVAKAKAFLERRPESRARFDKVVELVEGFESGFGLELLATVHWVLTRETPATLDGAIARIHAWSARKRGFTPRQIRLAADRLAARSWTGAPSLGPAPS